MAQDIALTEADHIHDVVAAIKAIAKTSKISPNPADKSITVEANSREAGLAQWLVGELDHPGADPGGYGYAMPHDKDDVTLVLAGIRLPSGVASHVATTAELQDVVGAIRLLSEMARTEIYAPANAVIWRGKVWQSDLALWLFRQLETRPAGNWGAPFSYRINQPSPSVRVFCFSPDTAVEDLRQMVSAIRSGTRIQRVELIGAERAIALRGTDTEAAAAERIVASAKR